MMRHRLFSLHWTTHDWLTFPMCQGDSSSGLGLVLPYPRRAPPPPPPLYPPPPALSVPAMGLLQTFFVFLVAISRVPHETLLRLMRE